MRLRLPLVGVEQHDAQKRAEIDEARHQKRISDADRRGEDSAQKGTNRRAENLRGLQRPDDGRHLLLRRALRDDCDSHIIEASQESEERA